MLTVDVKGMTCARCVNAITRAIKSLPNVETVSGKAALYRRVLFLNHGEAQSKCSPARFHNLSVAYVASGGLCAMLIAIDEFQHPQHMWIMNIVWPVVALFGSAWIFRQVLYGWPTGHEKCTWRWNVRKSHPTSGRRRFPSW